VYTADVYIVRGEVPMPAGDVPRPRQTAKVRKAISCFVGRGGVIYESRGREDMSGLVQDYWPLRGFSFLKPSPSAPAIPYGQNGGGPVPRNGSLNTGPAVQRQTDRTQGIDGVRRSGRGVHQNSDNGIWAA